MVARVFVSHASADSVLAGEVSRWLSAAGHDVFLDQDLNDGLVVGEEWERRLHERLRWADALVCVVTAAYVASTWCTAELVIAQTRGGRVLPVWAEPRVAHPLLTAVEHADVASDPDAARARLLEALRRVDAAGGGGWPEGKSPFPGLRAFESAERRVFFGRNRDIERLADLLRSPVQRADPAAVVVVGPSGCGKSSLVRAGLVPAMVDEPGYLTVPAMLPGREPTAALARELAATARLWGLDWSVSQLRERLSRAGGALVEVADELLLAVPGPRRTRLLVVIDQLEELMTQTAPAERARFARLMAAETGGPVQVVATLRPEFLDQVLSSPELIGWGVRVHAVAPLRRDALASVIEGPARLAGIGVDAGLVARLVGDTDSGEALPLLAFALAELADGVERGGRLLASRYEQLGGVRGALARQADTALGEACAATGWDRDRVVSELLRLVTVDEQNRPTRWRVGRDELPDPVATAFEAFVTRRLLSTDLDDGVVTIGVAHEAFLSAWPPLAAEITARSVALRARRQVEQAAADWAAHGQRTARLWDGGQLAAALTDTGAHPRRGAPSAGRVALSRQAHDFLEASFRRDRRRRSRLTVILSTLLIVALAAATTAYIQGSSAEAGQRLATARLLLQQADAALNNNDPLRALRLAEASHVIHPASETQAGVVRTLFGNRYVGLIDGLAGPAKKAIFAPDGQTLVTVDGEQFGSSDSVRLWDVRNPGSPRPLGGPLPGLAGTVSSVMFSPDGQTLVTVDGEQLGSSDSVRLWDVRNPGSPRPLGGPLPGIGGVVNSAMFAPDGHTLVTVDRDPLDSNDSVRLWDVTDPASPRLGGSLYGSTGSVNSVVFARDRHILATCPSCQLEVSRSARSIEVGARDTVQLWELGNPGDPRPLGHPLPGITGLVSSVMFAPDGNTLVAVIRDQVGFDDAVRLWDVSNAADPRPLGNPLPGLAGLVNSVGFAPEGNLLATINNFQSVQLWNTASLANPQPIGGPLTGIAGRVNSVVFAPNGNTLAVASADQTVRLWEVTNPADLRPLGGLSGHTDSVNSVVFAPNGNTLATLSDDRTVRLWKVAGSTFPQPRGTPFAGSAGQVTKVAFAPDGWTIATADVDGAVQIWDVTTPDQPRARGGPLVPAVRPVTAMAFAPDGRTFATASGNGTTVQRWDVSNPDHPVPLGDPPPSSATATAAVPSTAAVTNTAVATVTATGNAGTSDSVPSTTTANAPSVASAILDPDGLTLAAADYDGTVRLWDVTDPGNPRLWSGPLAGSGRVAIVFASSGHVLATTDGDTVQLWDVTDPADPEPRGVPLTDPSGAVTSVVVAPDGRTVATITGNNLVRLWDVTDPNHADQRSDPILGSIGQSYGVVFAPHAPTLAIVGIDNAVRIWDLTDLSHPRPVGDPLNGHTYPVFAPDGTTLATVGGDGKVQLWDLTRLTAIQAEPMEQACALTHRSLDRSEWSTTVPNLPYVDACAG